MKTGLKKKFITSSKLFMTGHSSPPHDEQGNRHPSGEPLHTGYFHGKVEARLMMQEVDALMKDLQKEVIEELSGQSLERVLAELESLNQELSSPPHYPAKLSQVLARRLNLSLQQGARLVEALEYLDLTRYRCTFESLDERERQSRLEVLTPLVKENP
ncbi:MAG: hypothetical protein ACE5GM_06560 [bacterium]